MALAGWPRALQFAAVPTNVSKTNPGANGDFELAIPNLVSGERASWVYVATTQTVNGVFVKGGFTGQTINNLATKIDDGVAIVLNVSGMTHILYRAVSDADFTISVAPLENQ